jgi:flavin reductase (DIM6/NTAB) family NADH-FMN oxidoreductase RutF
MDTEQLLLTPYTGLAGRMGTPIDGAAFRFAMRHPANSVTLIASGQGEKRAGLTATAVCSLSDDPPSLLACVNKKSFALNTIRESGAFSVNFLHADQTDVAAVFAGQTPLRGTDRFDDRLWQMLETGSPVLKRCLAAFDCYVERQVDYATHTILIGRVADATHSDEQEALIYSRGKYHARQE